MKSSECCGKNALRHALETWYENEATWRANWELQQSLVGSRSSSAINTSWQTMLKHTMWLHTTSRLSLPVALRFRAWLLRIKILNNVFEFQVEKCLDLYFHVTHSALWIKALALKPQFARFLMPHCCWLMPKLTCIALFACRVIKKVTILETFKFHGNCCSWDRHFAKCIF